MPFDVTFTDRLPDTLLTSGREAAGVVVIGAFEESFSTALDVVSKQDYLRQWWRASQRIVDGYDTSAIITSFADRGGEVVGMWWPLYVLENGLVKIQNQLILREAINNRFSLQTCYDYIGKRFTVTDEGDPISEWTITVAELTTFAARLQEHLAEEH